MSPGALSRSPSALIRHVDHFFSVLLTVSTIPSVEVTLLVERPWSLSYGLDSHVVPSACSPSLEGTMLAKTRCFVIWLLLYGGHWRRQEDPL